MGVKLANPDLNVIAVGGEVADQVLLGHPHAGGAVADQDQPGFTALRPGG